jgi:hypothetical protein
MSSTHYYAPEVGIDDDALVILHVSDAHFGQPDERNETARITDALVTACHNQELVPDICIFSGDLSYSGEDTQFISGARWLTKLLEPWPNSALFLVPGNHDVVRGNANLILRHAFDTEQSFGTSRENLTTRLGHLSNFFSFHSSLKASFDKRLISDWSGPWGCEGRLTKFKRPIRVIGMNTSLLSCHNDDRGKLVQDISALNTFLGKHRLSGECVIVVGHLRSIGLPHGIKLRSKGCFVKRLEPICTCMDTVTSKALWPLRQDVERVYVP